MCRGLADWLFSCVCVCVCVCDGDGVDNGEEKYSPEPRAFFPAKFDDQDKQEGIVLKRVFTLFAYELGLVPLACVVHFFCARLGRKVAEIERLTRNIEPKWRRTVEKGRK